MSFKKTMYKSDSAKQCHYCPMNKSYVSMIVVIEDINFIQLLNATWKLL